MDKQLNDVDEAGAYVDDVDVSTKGTFEHHLDVLREVFLNMRICNLKLNPSKCAIYVMELSIWENS